MSLLNTNLHKHRPHGLAKNTFENLNNAFLKINMQYIKVIQKHYCEKPPLHKYILTHIHSNTYKTLH